MTMIVEETYTRFVIGLSIRVAANNIRLAKAKHEHHFFRHNKRSDGKQMSR